MAQHRRPARSKAAICIATLTALACCLLPASTLAANFTWSGGGAVSADAWSNAANWEGGAAPSGTVGTLTFPGLTSAACTAEPPTAACYTSDNDVSGLNVNELVLADNAPYVISGSGITLGAGGITGSPSGAYTGPFSTARLNVPLTLAAPQTWSLSGGNPFSNFEVGGGVSGSDTLGIDLSKSLFIVESDIEVGAVTVQGNGYVFLGYFGTPGSLNGTNGNAVSFGPETSVGVAASHVAVGPLTLAGGLSLGLTSEANKASTLAVNGGVTLSSTALVAPTIAPGTVAGTDYPQITATGNVELGGASFVLGDEEADLEDGADACDELTPGTVDTFITTTGSLLGTFGNVPNGTTVTLKCLPGTGTAPTAQINYTAHTVTATIETAGSGAKEAQEQEEAKKKAEEEAAKKKTEESGHTSGGGGGSSTGSTPSTGSSTGSGSGSSTPTASISTAQIVALLEQQLIPSGKAATIPMLLKSGGLTMSFKALEAGTAVIDWYEVPAGAKLAKYSKAKPVLVASGQMTFTGAGTGKIKVKLTAAGERLLKHAKQVKLKAKGVFTPGSGASASAIKEFVARK